MYPLAAISRVEIAEYVSTLILIYTILLFINILLSWIPRIPYHPVSARIITFVKETTDPYLNIFRKIIPPIGMFDISAIFAFIALHIVGKIITSLILSL